MIVVFMEQKITACCHFSMKISILNRFKDSGQEFYEFEMFDGPDGIEHIRGYATSLESVFVKLIEWRERISMEYYNSESFTENETN